MKIEREPRNDLTRIRRALNATNWDYEWLAERVPALVEEIECLRCELNEARNTPDLLLENFGFENVEELWQETEE